MTVHQLLKPSRISRNIFERHYFTILVTERLPSAEFPISRSNEYNNYLEPIRFDRMILSHCDLQNNQCVLLISLHRMGLQITNWK